jgi:hypothetical protein
MRLFPNIVVLGCMCVVLAGCAEPAGTIPVGSGCRWVAGAWYQLSSPGPKSSKNYAGWGVTTTTAAQCIAQAQAAAQNFYALNSAYQISVVESRPCHQQCAPTGGTSSIFSPATRKR